MAKRVSVTLTDELNEKFTQMAREKGLSKDKLLGNILANYKEPVHNERGAGRKILFSDDEKIEIRELSGDGMSYRAIAKEFRCSVGTVHKIINEQKN